MLFRPAAIVRNYARWAFLVIFIGLPLLFLYIVLSDSTAGILERIPIIVLFFALLILGVCLLWFAFWEKFFASIRVNNEGIVWRCLFRKKHFIPFDKCRYMGIAYEREDSLLHPILYISISPFPEEYLYKVHKIPCSNKFIKFAYSKDLVNYLIALFPKTVVYQLVAYCRKQEKT